MVISPKETFSHVIFDKSVSDYIHLTMISNDRKKYGMGENGGK